MICSYASQCNKKEYCHHSKEHDVEIACVEKCGFAPDKYKCIGEELKESHIEEDMNEIEKEE